MRFGQRIGRYGPELFTHLQNKKEENVLNILIVNDDGISADGIARLAKAAKEFGKVTVVAPKEQCSAMSARITLGPELEVRKEAFPVDGVDAYSVSGTPVDCVKVAVEWLLKERPDVIFSGINNGANVGVETSYSGTVAAAMEGILKGIPAMAFSIDYPVNNEVCDAYLPGIIRDLLERPISKGDIWNVNFPNCPIAELKGIKEDRTLSKLELYPDSFIEHPLKENDDCIGRIVLYADRLTEAEEGSDIEAILNGYISIGKITNVIWAK